MTARPGPHRSGNARTVVAVIGRYLAEIFPLARRELGRWRRHASRITSPVLRRQALATIDQEHMNAEGAALFAVLAPRSVRIPLVRLLVAYQTLYDYLDTITETPGRDHAADCLQLHHATRDALSPASPVVDWERFHPHRDRSDYLATLVAACRAGCRALPSFAAVEKAVLESVQRATDVQVLNHCLPTGRAKGLQTWAERTPSAHPGRRWWEEAAGACSTLDLHTLLALSGNVGLSDHEVRATVRYGATLSTLNTLLESLIDLTHDMRTGDHSYVAYYRDQAEAAERIASFARSTVAEACRLRHGPRHLAIAQAMIAMYLSRAEASSPFAAPAVRSVIDSVPPPIRTLTHLHRVVRLARDHCA